ncbi:DUF6911 family protein [Burkholderia lata]|uniref:DUF6911 family protein n=1 Tax=Burkholderia lata (strain ATCC 17760 / DSM 23089 / LMG 22485 / NCIMB 9086 / R18194 / 383) TaxID=482957 RepID=UPI00158445C6|nr:hypothetical protein [Burkholderia lata]
MNMILGGYVLNAEASRTQLHPVVNPDELKLKEYVEIFSSAEGVLAMKVDPEPDFGCVNLTMYSESGCYLLMMSDVIEDGSTNVRTLVDKDKEGGFVTFFGEPFPRRATTTNLNLIFNVFNEFLRGGAVSIDVMP